MEALAGLSEDRQVDFTYEMSTTRTIYNLHVSINMVLPTGEYENVGASCRRVP